MSDDTMWFDRKPGDKVSIGSEEHGDPSTLMLAEGPPDWVMLPKEIGGHRLKVLKAFAAQCPMCKHENTVRHLECEQGYFVAECISHGFAWYQRKSK